MLKDYSDYLALNAIEQVIVEEVRIGGDSSGWSGDLETFKLLKSKLEKEHIHYKYLGRWELCEN